MQWNLCTEYDLKSKFKMTGHISVYCDVFLAHGKCLPSYDFINDYEQTTAKKTSRSRKTALSTAVYLSFLSSCSVAMAPNHYDKQALKSWFHCNASFTLATKLIGKHKQQTQMKISWETIYLKRQTIRLTNDSFEILELMNFEVKCDANYFSSKNANNKFIKINRFDEITLFTCIYSFNISICRFVKCIRCSKTEGRFVFKTDYKHFFLTHS